MLLLQELRTCRINVDLHKTAGAVGVARTTFGDIQHGADNEQCGNRIASSRDIDGLDDLHQGCIDDVDESAPGRDEHQAVVRAQRDWVGGAARGSRDISIQILVLDLISDDVVLVNLDHAILRDDVEIGLTVYLRRSPVGFRNPRNVA